MKRYIAALDQGTTSSRCILFDREQNIIGSAQRELTQIYPKPGWVEQDPMEIWSTQYSVLTEVLAQTGVAGRPAVPSPMPSCGSAAAQPPCARS